MLKVYFFAILTCFVISQSPLSERYHTYDDIVDSLMAWDKNFSNNTFPSPYYANSGIIYQMEQIGESNVDNLPIYAVKLSYNADQSLDKPRVLILLLKPDVIQPSAVGLMPLDGFSDAFLKCHFGFPAQQSLGLGNVRPSGFHI